MSRASVAQSVRNRLLNRKRETGENYEALLTRYALERLLYRLSKSDLRDQFIYFEGATLAEAVQSTFKRRETSLPASPPDALTSTFAQDEKKQQQWSAFLNRTRLEIHEPALKSVIAELRAFLWPLLDSLRQDSRFDQQHPPGGSWTEEE